MKRNKTASRWISCLLCMAMMLSLFSGITVLAAEKAASGEEDKVLFSTRFKTQEEFSNFADVPVEVNATLRYGNSAEDVSALIDGSTSTKLCATGGVKVPLEFTFHYNAPTTASNYYISGANDDEGNPGRTLNSWELYGTNDQTGEWTRLDTQSNQTGWKNYEMRVFQLPEGPGYQHYKLKITKFNSNPGTIQFSGFGLTRSLVDDNFAGTTDTERTQHASMTTKLENDKLVISGHHEGNQSAQVYNVLYTGLNIPVTENTRLVYNITPQQPLPNNKYDYDFYSMHLAVDLKFDDGTYLSSTGLEDENGVRADPNSQGEGKAMLYAQENQILIQLGALKDKTIEEIGIGYANSADLKADGGDFKGTLNSIRIENVAPLNYDKESLVDYAYILRGTNNFGGAFFSRGLTGPMVAVPHGFNFWAPENDTGNTMFDYNAGYIRGFRCSHEPSIWVGDRSVWRFMPGVNTSANGRAIYDQENVTAKPYYFSVQFNQSASNPASGVRTELSPTDHGMIARITYPENAQTPYINISDVSGLAFDTATKSFSGYKNADSNQMPKMYIYGTFDQAFTDDGTRAVFGQGTKTVVMRAATSFISAEQAQKNFELELNGEFDTVKAAAKTLWNDKLSQFEIEGASEEQRITFYSCLYRLYLYPNNMGEKTGEGSEDGWQYMSPYTKTVKDGKLYYNNGFWDTYRTTWAAYSLFTPEQNNELLLGLIHHFEDSGWMPRWIAPAGTNSMVGTSSDVIFADAMLRGATLTDEQWQLAYQSALKNASMSDFKGASGGRDGIDKGLFLGYTPGGDQKFSWSIEGYINDAGIANMAKALDDTDAYTYYKSRATNYVNLFRDGDGVENKWLAAKNADGSWTRRNVDPFAFHDDYTETTALNMACSVPQDGQGLANLYGGRAELAEKLDQLFKTTLETDTVGTGQGIHERREAQEVKMGEYGHSNQPSHHIPYMYLYAGRPDRTQEKVRQVLRQCYVGSRIGQGYIGDEDNGEMSAWFIFSAMGFYPLNMGSGELVFGSPLFKKITLHYENGHDLIIEAPNNSSTNIYVGGLTINGEAYSKTSIKQTDLTDRLKNENVVLHFDMQATPGAWGRGENDVPDSLTKGDGIPDPLRDRTNSAAVVAEDIPTTLSSGDSIYCANGENLKNLLDNNSKTSATLKPTDDGRISLYYTFAKPQAVSLYTLTSASGGKDRAPKNFTLYLSNDGVNWTEADKREDVTFEWSLYTKPFKTNAADYAQYRYVRLDIESDSEIQLGELELMSTGMPALNADALNGMIAEAIKAKDALHAGGYAPLVTLMGAAIGEAQTVAGKEDKTDDEIKEACRNLINAMSEIEGMKDLWTKLDAIKKVDTSNMPSAVQNSVRSAISNAENVTKNYSSTMDELKDAKSQLEQAANDIQSYQDLAAKIEEAQRVYDGLAGDAAYKEQLNQAIQNARTALNNPNATTEDFKRANDELDLNIKLAQEKFRNAYKNIEAEEFTKFETDAYSGIANDGKNIGGVKSGTWVKYSNVYFSGNGAKEVTFFYSAQQRDAGGGQIHVRLGSLDGKEIATLTCPATGENWENYVELSDKLTEVTKGMHDVYLYFENTTGQTYIANVDWFRFTEASSSHEHSWSNEWSKDETHHWHACSGCDAKNDEAAHTPGSAATENDPQTCTVCGYIIAPATGHIKHTTAEIPAKAANCHEKGNRAYYTCSGCSDWFEDAEATVVIADHNSVVTEEDPNNHVGGTEIRDARAATETSEGYTGDTYCLGCHRKIEEGQTIPKLTHTHTMVFHPAKAPTETAEGNIAYWKCSVCGRMFTDEAGLNEVFNVTLPKLTPAPVIPVTPSEPAQLPFNPNAGSNVSKFPFVDIPSDSWYYSSVKAAWENGLIDGVTANEFKPNATLTLAQTIKLAAALHQLDRTGEVSLKNSGANWYDSYVNYAVVNGIIEKNYANYTKAQMNAPVTRGEFVHIFHGAEEAYKAINTVADNAIPDVKTTDKFAPEIYEFYRAGILTGSDAKGTFHSASTIKRSEAAAILLRMFEASARVSIDLP